MSSPLPPPVNTLDDLRRLALNAGTYGVVTIPAQALLDLLSDLPSAEDTPTAAELKRLIRDAEYAAGQAEDAAADLEHAARALARVNPRPTPTPDRSPR